MKKLKVYALVSLAFFLVACGAVTPAPFPTAAPFPTRAPATAATLVPSWPGFHNGWMTFDSQPKIDKVIYDPHGYLWATTNKGLYRVNIETSAVKLYNELDILKGNPRVVYFDGKIWVFSSDSKQSAYLFQDKWTEHPIDFGYISGIFNTGDRLWLSAEKGLYYRNDQGWKLFENIPASYNGYISKLAKSKDGSLWLFAYSRFSSGSNVMRFDGQTWREYPNLDGLNNMLTTSDGVLWFIFQDGLISFDGQHFTPPPLPNGEYFGYSIFNSLLTSDGNLWLKIDDDNALVVNSRRVDKQPFDSLGKNDKFPKGVYEPAALIPQGWVFYTQNEIYIKSDKVWKKYSLTNADLINHLVGHSVIGFTSDGAMWVLGYDGLARFDGKKIENIPYQNYGDIWKIDPNGMLWNANTASEYLSFDDLAQSESEAKSVNLHNAIVDFSLSPDGGVWLALKNGYIAKFLPTDMDDSGSVELKKIKIGGGSAGYHLAPSRIEVDAAGNVWVLLANAHALYRYDGKNWKYYDLFTVKEKSAFAIGLNDKVWTGVTGILYEHDGTQWIKHLYGFPCPSHMTVAPDQSVWFVGGCAGVYRFDGKDWSAFALSKELGGILPSQIVAAPDGAMWFFSDAGWARYKP